MLVIAREAGVAMAVEERDVGRGTRGGMVVDEGTTRLPWSPNAPPSFVMSAGLVSTGVPTLV